MRHLTLKFDKNDLSELVECAKRALEREEQYLAECIKSNRWDFGPTGGLMCNPNEHYFQFLIWRELMKSFRFRPITEHHKRSDLAFRDKSNNGLVAVAEIKGWWADEKKDQAEVRAIRRDINKMQFETPSSVKMVMLVLTTYIKEDRKDWFTDLARRLKIPREEIEVRTFDNTEEGDDERWEFAIGGFFVPPA